MITSSMRNGNVHYGGIGNPDQDRQDDSFEDDNAGNSNLYTFDVTPPNSLPPRTHRPSSGSFASTSSVGTAGSGDDEDGSSSSTANMKTSGMSPQEAVAASTPRQMGVVEDQLYNVEQILQELVKRNEVLKGPNRKRKITDERERIINQDIEENYRTFMLSHMNEESDSSEDDLSAYADYPLTTTVSISETFQASNPPFMKSPMFSVNEPVIAQDFMPDFTTFLPHVPPEVFEQIQTPLRGCSPTTKALSPPRAQVLEQSSNHKLFQAFMSVSAERLSYTSPAYIDLWRRYVPAMAQNSPALMEAVLALGALQAGLLRQDEQMLTVDSTFHYQRALALHGQALAESNVRDKEAPLATAMIMTHYEGENVKMGVHMLGARDIILGRGKEAFLTPVGRALFTNFKRFDIASSAISGNPCFLTHDWWYADPMTRIPVVHDAPPLFVADALLSKSTIICSKLTYVKAWAVRRRRDLWIQNNNGTSPSYAEKKQRLQESIVRKCERLEADMDEWRKEFPDWFCASDDNVNTGRDGQEEDINSTDIHVIFPRKYSHWSIGAIEAWEISIRLQLYRIKYPDVPIAEPKMGGLVHKMLRIFASLPIHCDGLMMACLFIAGMELRKKPHQKWFCDMLQLHMQQTSFAGFMFVLQGCRFAWSKLEGLNRGRFARVKEGSAARIEGVSENLWSAEGVLGALEALSLYDSPDVSSQRKNFQGDFEQGLGDDADFEESAEKPGSKPNKRHQPEEHQRSRDGRQQQQQQQSPMHGEYSSPEESPSPISSTANGWNEYDAQHTNGMANGNLNSN